MQHAAILMSAKLPGTNNNKKCLLRLVASFSSMLSLAYLIQRFPLFISNVPASWESCGFISFDGYKPFLLFYYVPDA